jgi:hypothetical protein
MIWAKKVNDDVSDGMGEKCGIKASSTRTRTCNGERRLTGMQMDRRLLYGWLLGWLDERQGAAVAGGTEGPNANLFTGTEVQATLILASIWGTQGAAWIPLGGH